MADSDKIQFLRHVLREEVSAFCRHDSLSWKRGVTETVDGLREKGWNAVFFGGTLRSLLLSRLTQGVPGRPRDVDIVVKGTHLSDLKARFKESFTRETRFGGLQLKHANWQFDMWPLNETHALKSEGATEPEFADLPGTTFLNIEAVAVDVWPQRGKPRQIYSGDDKFFAGVINRLVDINKEENPFPELCVVRSLVMTNSLRWRLSNRLGRYIAFHGKSLSASELENIQLRHYGSIFISGPQMLQWIRSVSKAVEFGSVASIALPWMQQLELWPDDAENDWPRINLRLLKRHSRSKNRKRAHKRRHTNNKIK